MDFFGLASFYNLSLPVCAPFLILVVSTHELNGSTHGTQSTGPAKVRFSFYIITNQKIKNLNNGWAIDSLSTMVN